MTATLGSIAIAALLFMVFGAQQIRHGCGGDCGNCDETCGIKEVHSDKD